MSSLPTIGFDTSSINALVDKASLSEPLMAALRLGFHVFLPAMVAEEILSCPKSDRREALLERCQRLLASGTCIWPPHEVLRRLILEHRRTPNDFNWARVAMGAGNYESAIIRRDFTDECCARQRSEQFQLHEDFRKMWAVLRPKLDAVLVNEPSS
jgi:hypothetical protein